MKPKDSIEYKRREILAYRAVQLRAVEVNKETFALSEKRLAEAEAILAKFEANYAR